MNWNNSDDLMTEIKNAHRRMREGQTTAREVAAEARLFQSAVRLHDIQLKHAKETGRLKPGSEVLPGYVGAA